MSWANERNKGATSVDYKQKRGIIEGLLDHWQDFTLPSVGGPVFTDGSEGVGILFTSGMGSYPSVRELDRILGVLERMGPTHYRHLRGFYASEWRTTDVPTKIRAANGKLVDSTARARVRVVPRWVEWRLVDRALDALVGLWDGRVTLELPPALNRKLREFTDADGTHLTEAA